MKIEYKCQVKDVIAFRAMIPFQGKLKSRSEDDVQKLANSLEKDGLLMPFVLWYDTTKKPDEQVNYILDGHARYAAITWMGETNPEVLKQEYPFIHIAAATIEEAQEQLLQISSSYGRITPKGLKEFLSKAPSIKLENIGIKVKVPAAIVRVPVEEKRTIIRLSVEKDMVQELLKILEKVQFVRVL